MIETVWTMWEQDCWNQTIFMFSLQLGINSWFLPCLLLPVFLFNKVKTVIENHIFKVSDVFRHTPCSRPNICWHNSCGLLCMRLGNNIENITGNALCKNQGDIWGKKTQMMLCYWQSFYLLNVRSITVPLSSQGNAKKRRPNLVEI